MAQDIAGFVLAAGSGTRLRPLTDLRPKALCPVNNVALGDSALNNVQRVTQDVTMNTSHHSDQVLEHFDNRVRLVVEDVPLGTAGALGNQLDWIDGRGVLVHNADAWHQFDLTHFCDSWDGQTPRLLVQYDEERGDFGPLRFCGVSLLPWNQVKDFEATPSGLWEVSWRYLSEGDIDFVRFDGPFFDCGTHSDYLTANLVASGGESVIAPTAKVEGSIQRCVLWDGAVVGPNETLSDVIRVPGLADISGLSVVRR